MNSLLTPKYECNSTFRIIYRTCLILPSSSHQSFTTKWYYNMIPFKYITFFNLFFHTRNSCNHTEWLSNEQFYLYNLVVQNLSNNMHSLILLVGTKPALPGAQISFPHYKYLLTRLRQTNSQEPSSLSNA